MYSLSAGLSSGSHETTFYAGNIREIDGDHQTGRLHDGSELDVEGLLGMQVATVAKASGSPRALNWPVAVASNGANAAIAGVGATGVSFYIELSNRLTPPMLTELADIVMSGTPLIAENVNHLNQLAEPQLQELISVTLNHAAAVVNLGSAASQLSVIAYQLAFAYHLAKSLVWADSYTLQFNGNGGSTDDLLVNIVAAVQDLTRENLASSVR